MTEKLKVLLEEILNEEFAIIEKVENFKDLEFWDSLTYVNLVVGLEKEFQIALTENEIGAILSVNSVEQVLSNHGIVL